MHPNLTISRIKLLILLCVTAIAMQPAHVAAQSITINLGQSAQNYVLTGTGSSVYLGNTVGNYYNAQGNCVTSGATTTCDLTGTFTSSTSPFASGTYDFQTVFTGSITTSILSRTTYPPGTTEPNDFQYAAFAPSLTMNLIINVTGGAAYTIPLAAHQNFAVGLDNINFVYTSAVCGGTSLGSDPCQQDYVGTVAGATYTGTVTGTVVFSLPSPPVISPGTGTYTSAQSVTLTAPTTGTAVYYTTNGSTPTAQSTPYISPIPVSSSETINAVAITSGGVASPIASATYTFAGSQTPTPAPTFYPFAGTYTSAQNVTLSDSISGAAIYYTTDGSTPTTSSQQYTTPIAVSSSETINAIALASGDTVSTVASAAYSIVPNPLSENGDWGWVGGFSTDTTPAAPAIYGTMGQPASTNQPGGRSGAATWVDATGSFWMFGGLGADVNDIESFLQDLWKYDPSANQWTWVFGNDDASITLTDYGSYGTQGVASASNAPPEITNATTWTDHAGNLWMYGGLGAQSATHFHAYLSSLWEYNVSTGEWIWVNGQNNDAAYVPPTYGTQGVAAASNSPGGRYGGASWVDQQGNLWLFGGNSANGVGQTSSNLYGDTGDLNDLWEFNIATGQWTWIGGGTTYGLAGTYGTLGQAASGNIPSSREYATTWTDSDGNFWLFGGDVVLGTSTIDTQLNDLWKYSPASHQWTWMGGSTSTAGQANAYGTIGVPSTATTPGSRTGASGWTDSYGNFWLFGGTGEDTVGGDGGLNDLWMYTLSTNQWTRKGGSSTVPNPSTGLGAPGIYGTLGVPAQGNTPGGRGASMAWADKTGNLWLFGGSGADSAGTSFHQLNDLWEYHFAALGSAVAPTVTVTPASSSIVSSTALSVQVSVTGANGTATGSVTLSSGTYASAATTLSSGTATITVPAGSLPTGTDTLTAAFTPDAGSSSAYTSATGTSPLTVTSPVVAVAPTVTVTPAATSITTAQSLSVTVSVSGMPACSAAQQGPRPSVVRPEACPGATPGTGSIVLSGGGYTSSAITLNKGSATLTIPAGSLAIGTDTLTATYTPDANSASTFTSATGTTTVAVTAPAATPTVTVTPAASSITTAQSLSVTIAVGGTACATVQHSTSQSAVPALTCTNPAVATGSIVLSGGGYTSSAVTLTNGAATITIPAGALATGTDTLTAAYTPDAASASTYNPASGTASVTVTTPVVTAPVTSLSPASLSFTATSGSTSATQTVTLSNTGNAALSITAITLTGTNASDFAQTNTCGTSLAAGSTCTISVTFTPASAATFTATLNLADNAANSPQTLALTGTASPAPSFTLTSATPSATVTPTTTATYQIVVTPQNGSFGSPVTLSASGVPAGYTPSFSPATVTPGSSAANSTLTIKANSLTGNLLRIFSGPTLALLGILLWPGRRRRRLTLCALAFLSVLAVGTLSGCGAGFNFITPAQTYTLTVTATGAGQTQSTTVQLTVQQ